jgi:hypothetical protein
LLQEVDLDDDVCGFGDVDGDERGVGMVGTPTMPTSRRDPKERKGHQVASGYREERDGGTAVLSTTSSGPPRSGSVFLRTERRWGLSSP